MYGVAVKITFTVISRTEKICFNKKSACHPARVVFVTQTDPRDPKYLSLTVNTYPLCSRALRKHDYYKVKKRKLS